MCVLCLPSIDHLQKKKQKEKIKTHINNNSSAY